MFIVTYRKIFFAISLFFILGSFAAFQFLGLRLGTDFTGGTILEVSYNEDRPSAEDVRNSLNDLSLGNYSVRLSGDSGMVIRTREITFDEKEVILSRISNGEASSITEERFNSIGPVAGASLKRKSYYAISIVILAIVLFITFAFRKVSETRLAGSEKGLPSWKYGFATILALAHDVIVPLGAYVVYGYFTGAEIDLLFITALLAILGYSVHDTIVVFDRVREHLLINKEKTISEPFPKTVGESITQTMGRSINTSVTLLIVLIVLYFVGSEATKHFSFILLVGVIAGTYSSIFLASPLLVTLEKLQKRKSAN
jgi:preprotein translocase subunit SecF